MEKVVWWNRPIEGRGERPTTPKPTPINTVTRQVIPGKDVEIHAMGGKQPTTAKPAPAASASAPVPTTKK